MYQFLACETVVFCRLGNNFIEDVGLLALCGAMRTNNTLRKLK
jgi:hypothetical protein